MASPLRDELDCSICLNVYTDPVTLSCGHNFCWVCIDRVLDTQEASGAYSCPDCRAVFQERPALQRNITLCNIAVRILSAESEQDKMEICTYCIHSPVPAVKICLMCEASLCANHLRVHSKSEEHVLTEPITSLENRRCPIHKKVLMYYCTEDASCVCVTCCLAGEHRGHVVELLNVAAKIRNNKLRTILGKCISKKEEAKEGIHSLHKHHKDMSSKAAGLTKQVSALFRDIRRQLEDLEERVLSEISRQEEQVSRSVSELIQQMEIKKDELCKKIRHIEELGNMTDPVTVLQELDRGDFCDTEEGDNEDKERHDKQAHIVEALDEGLISVTLHTGLSDVMSGRKRGISVREASDIFLDVQTAANAIIVSGSLKSFSWSDIEQEHPETPERFQMYPQVLSTRTFSSGHYYWDIETSEFGNWRVGVTYPSINRRGIPALIGENSKSWSLRRCNNQYSLRHNCCEIMLPDNISCDRFRIYLDYEGGRLSLYELCDPIKHLHTFTATFTEPLHAAFGAHGGWVRIRS